MDEQGFLDFNIHLSAENSGKARSYARAISILDDVLQHQSIIDLQGQSLYNISDISVIERVFDYVYDEVNKLKRQQPSIFNYIDPGKKSYPLKNFCTAALKSLKRYAEYEQEVSTADSIVAQESNASLISRKLIAHFDINRDGEDKLTLIKHRKGQDYFRHMILRNYDCRCALTGINISQLLIASHIIPWEDKTHKKERLNPCNGILLSALYDKAFDKGFISFSPDDYSVCLSSALMEYEVEGYFKKHFGSIDGRKLTLPTDYKPDRDFLAYHRDVVFLGK